MLFDTLSLKFQTLTPLFLGGANPRGIPELRASSVRGAMRYWLRAVLGGTIGDDYETVHKRESEVLGDTDTASGLTVRLSQPAFTPQLYQKQGTTHGPHGKPQPTGRDYLYWSMASTGNADRRNLQPPKQSIPAATDFSVTLASRFADEDATRLFQASAALWLLTHLGGLGSRSRRTAGSLSVISPSIAPGQPDGLAKLPPFQLSAATARDWAAQLAASITAIRSSFPQATPPPPIHRPTRFDILHPRVCDIWVLNGPAPWKTSEDAIKAIGEALRDFRSYREPDHDNVRTWIEGRTIPTVERAAFGLPLPFRYSNGGPADVVLGTNQVERRSSPLWLRVSRLANGHYVGIAVLFHSGFLAEGEKLMLQRTKARTAPPSDYALLRDFVTQSFNTTMVNYL